MEILETESPLYFQASTTVTHHGTETYGLVDILSEHGVATDPSKVQKVQMWPTVSSSQEVRRYIGLASYYWRFVQYFPSIAKPLHNLAKKNACYQWHAEDQAAFDKLKLKYRLTLAPILG